jgi:hypothetical protein
VGNDFVLSEGAAVCAAAAAADRAANVLDREAWCPLHGHGSVERITERRRNLESSNISEPDGALAAPRCRGVSTETVIPLVGAAAYLFRAPAPKGSFLLEVRVYESFWERVPNSASCALPPSIPAGPRRTRNAFG